MLFTEKEFNSVKKKIEIEMYFMYDYRYEENVRYMFNIYYDSGNGLQYTILDDETLEFATDLCKDKIDKYRKYIKPLYNNPFLSISTNPKEDSISNDDKRMNLSRELLSFADAMSVPVFLHTNDNYLLLNEKNVLRPKTKEALNEYLEKEYHNDEYEYAKKERAKFKFKNELEASHKSYISEYV